MKFRPPYPDRLPDPNAEGGYPKAVEDYLVRLRAFYGTRAAWHRRFYRFSGILVIMVGAGLPLLTTLSYPDKDLVVSLVGVLIAVLTALRAFYQWDQNWVLLRGTERTITLAWWEYQAKVATSPPPSEAERHEAARQLVALLAETRKQEAEFFFKDMRFPTGKGDGQQ